MSNKTIPSIRFSNTVIRFLRRLGIDSPKKAFVAVLVSNIVTQLAAAFYFNAWDPFILPSGLESPGLSGEPGAWVICLIAQPVLIGMMVWVSYSGDKLVKILIDQKTITISPELEDALQQLNGKLNSKWFNFGAWVFGCVVQTLMLLIALGIVGSNNPTWLNVHPSIMIYRTLVAIPVYYSVPIIVGSIWMIMSTLSKNLKLQDVLNIEPFHADGVGGLAPIGKFVANIGYLLLALGFVIAGLFFQSWLFGEAPNTGYLTGAVLALVVYLVCTPLLIIVPLFAIHKLMLKFKESRKAGISTELNRLFSLATGDLANTNQDHVIRMRYLTELKELSEQIPTWPISNASLRKFYSLTLSPFISLFIGLASSMIIDLIVETVR